MSPLSLPKRCVQTLRTAFGAKLMLLSLSLVLGCLGLLALTQFAVSAAWPPHVAWVALASSAGALWLARALARRWTAPLQTLVQAADRIALGDYDTPVPQPQTRDELAQVALAFDRMRARVAEKRAEVLRLAYTDELTDLPSRAHFRDAVAEAIEAARHQMCPKVGVAVLMLDLDRFKHVNDVLGYSFGDLLLQQVAWRLSQQVLRSKDMVARLGGDEFAVLLREGDASLAKTVALRITQAFEQPLHLTDPHTGDVHTVDMHAGIGMACWPAHADTTEVLISHAEVAMYAAKRRKLGPTMYDPSFDASSKLTLSMLSELRHAIDHHELRLFLQPKLSLDTSQVVGAETLVRWEHPQRGLLLPIQFIPFAEQTGFIRHLTQWVFEEAARHWKRLHASGASLPLSVNLSTRDLLDPELPQKFDALLLSQQVPAEGFCLEITESAIMDDPQRALLTLERLSAQGFKLSIDDFGTGYSSLAYLKKLPVDELKIDKSFVMGMEGSDDDTQIVRSTIDLAHNLGLSVVAEGVENARVWELLRDMRCDQAQGYYMGKPMPADEFERWTVGWLGRNRPAAPAQVSPTLH
jgi:diguanylate cyclase (GGDEF)-like protein